MCGSRGAGRSQAANLWGTGGVGCRLMTTASPPLQKAKCEIHSLPDQKVESLSGLCRVKLIGNVTTGSVAKEA